MIWQLKDLIQHNTQTLIADEWVPARPVNGKYGWNWRAAWLVLLGKADAVVWPGGQ